MKTLCYGIAVAACLGVAPAATVSAPSSSWTSLAGNYDFLDDQQTGQPASDIVGTAANPGFFNTFNNNGNASATDGTLGFRIRLDAAGGNANNPRFDRVAWIGIDANLDSKIDAYLGLGSQGGNPILGIYAPGDSANTGPSTTSIASSPAYSYTISSTNYDYRPVNSATDGGTTNDLTSAGNGDIDYYLSVLLPFGDLVSYLATQNITITDQSALRYVVATSTQHNSLNQDLGGVNGQINSTLTWQQLGGLSQPVNASGNPVVPEPSSVAVAATLLVLAAIRRRK